MGQGIYRCVGWGCLNPPPFDFDSDTTKPLLLDLLEVGYETEPNYAMVPFGVDDGFDDGFLQRDWNLPGLPNGLPHVGEYEAVVGRRCQWWPDVGKDGVWVCRRIVETWELIRAEAKRRGWELPEGQVIFVCDWH